MGKLEDHVATVVLAAGYSARMGGAFKPLLKLGNDTVVERAVQSHLDAGVRDVRVVVGHRAAEVIATIQHLDVRIVRNQHFAKGMFSSVQAGVATLKAAVRVFFIMPGDIPLVDPATIRAVLKSYEKNPCGIIYPTCGGRKGHPPLIASRYISEIMESLAPDGLRGILSRHETEARMVEVDDEGILVDIDTWEDYSRLRCHGDRKDIPDQAQCMKLLEEARVEGPVLDHCCLVALVACQLVRLLNGAGAGVDEKLVRAAALLHDIRRSEKDHAQAGAKFLRARGYARVAEIVAAHIDVDSEKGKAPSEKEIVYLADKLVMGQRCVPLQERFAAALERHGGDEQVRLSILQRHQQAEKIKNKVQTIIGCALEEVPLGKGSRS